MTTRRILLVLVLLTIGFRVMWLPMIHNPGIADPAHYYNLGRSLLQGQGFVIDYVWHYHMLHEDIVHPIDHWMPLTGVLVAVGFLVAGESVFGALLPMLLLSGLLPLIVYASARQMRLEEDVALIVASFSITLPDFVINALRPETTLPAMLLVSTSILLLGVGLRRGVWWAFVGAGVLAGLAYLTRNDALLLLPMLVVTVLVWLIWGRGGALHRGWRRVWLMPVVMGLVVAPWLARNMEVLGRWGSPETGKMFFMVDTRDHYAYGYDIDLAWMLAQQTPAELIGKRVFEFMAAVKQLLVSLDVALPVAFFGGLVLLWYHRDRDRLLTASPVLILMLGTFIAYPIFIPLKSQSGSFVKALLAFFPLLLPIAGYAIQHAIPDRRMRWGAGLLVVAIMGANSFDLIRTTTQHANNAHAFTQEIVAVVQTLPDMTGDGEVRLMTQDPFTLSYYGVRSVFVPMASIEDTFFLADYYGIDYLLLPASRPLLDPIMRGEASHPRLERVATLRGGSQPHALFAILPPNTD